MCRLSISAIIISAAFLSMFVASNPVLADDVTDSINEALKQYSKGTSLTPFRVSIMRLSSFDKRKADSLRYFYRTLFLGGRPKRLNRRPWICDVRRRCCSRTFLCQRRQSCRCQDPYGFPMMQAMMMMFSNPMMATSDGGKLEKINGEKAIVKYSNDTKDGDINMVIANRFSLPFMETMSPDRIDLLCSGIDFKKLAAMP